jgi:hypothetical protein
MNRGRVGEERGGKETDGCPLTVKQRIKMAAMHQRMTTMETDM